MSYGTTKAQAAASAKAARMKMRKPGLWRISLNDNVGWYWCLEHVPSDAALTVWPSNDGKFHVLLTLTGGRCGDMRWSGLPSLKSPQKAVDKTVLAATKIIEAEQARLKSITIHQ